MGWRGQRTHRIPLRRQLRMGRTSAEIKMAAQLDLMGLIYEEQVRVEGFRPDFWLPGAEIALEANGDWWHRTDMWIKTDTKKLGHWREKGVRFFGVWESRLDKQPETFRRELRKMIQDTEHEPEFWDWGIPRV